MTISCRASMHEAFQRFAKVVTHVLKVEELSYESLELSTLLYQKSTDTIQEDSLPYFKKSFQIPVEIFQNNPFGFLNFTHEPDSHSKEILDVCLKTFTREIELMIKNQALEDGALARFKHVFDQAPFSIQICSRDGKILAINPAWLKIFKLPEEFVQNFLLKDYNVLTDPLLEASGFLPIIKRGFEGEVVTIPEMLYDPVVAGIQLKGQWLRAQVFPLKNTRGEFNEVVVIHNNVTEIYEANLENQKLLKEQERHIDDQKILSDVTSILMGTLDHDRIIHEVAGACIEKFCDGFILDHIEGNEIKRLVTRHKLPETEFLLSEVRRLYPPDFESPQPSSVVIRTGKPEFLKNIDFDVIAVRTKSPEHHNLIKRVGIHSHIAVPLMIRGEIIGALNFIISTDRAKFTEEDLQMSIELSRRAAIAIENAKLYREANKAIKLRDDFISIASHELKTPLTSMKLQMFIAARMLANEADKIDYSFVKNLTDVSNRQLDRITRLVEDMLDISRISQGKIILNSQRKNLSALVQDVIQRFTYQLNEDKITIKSELEEEIYIYCDPLRIEQVITNLLTNAIRYGQKKPIQLSLRTQGEIAEIKITDKGIGITPDNHERIFGRFERAVGFEMSGLGLGLYISKQIIDEHHGKISVESEIGQGATFKVSLPCL